MICRRFDQSYPPDKHTLPASVLVMKNPTSDLPPELQAFASLLDTQPPEVQEAFQFPLATAMHEADKFELLNVVEVDGQWHYTFSGVGEAFSKAPGLNVANPDAWRVRTDDAIYHSCPYSCFMLR